MQIDRLEKGEIIVRIHTLGGKKVKLRLTGDEAVAWAAKLINVRDRSLGHRTHPYVDFTVQDGANSNGVLECFNQENATFASKASPSASSHSKYSYSVTLNDSTVSNDDFIGPTGSQKELLLNGDVPSMLGSAKFGITERARGGKIQEDASELIYSIRTSPSNTFSKDTIRKKVDDLMKSHIHEEERRERNVLMNLK